VANFLDLGDSYSNIASLSHTVIFHDEADGINLLDSTGKPKWFCVEGIGEHISHGRAMLNTKMWDVTSQKLVASGFQDGMVRFKLGSNLADPGGVKRFTGGHKM
jgi:acyl-CoA thioesterase